MDSSSEDRADIASAQSQSYAEVAHETIFRRWGKLSQWITDERGFLAWRTGIEAARRGRLRLAGAPLVTAHSWLARRRADLAVEDCAYISQAWWRRKALQGLAVVVILVVAVGGGGSLWERYAMATRLPLLVSATKPLDDADPRLRKTGEIFQECTKCPEMVVMPYPAAFRMGASDKEDMSAVKSYRQPNEQVQHEVKFGKRFAVARYETTYEEWDVCHELGGCRTNARADGGRGRKPATYVNWFDAREYVAWLSKWTGKKYRLLSEAEWEYAARAGTETNFWWGNAVTESGKQMANCIDCYDKSNRQTTEVGAFPANPFGLHDMNGNVWEWVEDCYHPSYNPKFKPPPPSNGSPWIDGERKAGVDEKEVDCGSRGVRGGSITEHAGNVRSGFRGFRNIGSADMDSGIRVARELTD
jgi:formylglycine-generating enzyme required for sulfatase activity